MQGEKMATGLVMKSTGSWYEVRLDDKRIIPCRIRGKIRLKGIKVTNPVAVGDIVDLEFEDSIKGIIHNIHPRQNYLIRKSTRKEKYGHILAANLDQCILVATLTLPRTSIGFIDRFLVSAESFRIPSIVVFNKKDIYDDAMLDEIGLVKEIYEKIGVKVLCISAKQKEGIDEFIQILKGKKSLIAGHSGVGKSTILNQIAPHKIEQKVGEVSSYANKGTHTTTFAEMFELDDNTFVVDTPGIKELGLIDMENEEIAHYFPEMRAFLGECKFNNCTHLHEPGCAVKNAVEKGIIHMSRYNSYLSIMSEEDTYR